MAIAIAKAVSMVAATAYLFALTMDQCDSSYLRISCTRARQ
jgi:hypothetical protein